MQKSQPAVEKLLSLIKTIVRRYVKTNLRRPTIYIKLAEYDIVHLTQLNMIVNVDPYNTGSIIRNQIIAIPKQQIQFKENS